MMDNASDDYPFHQKPNEGSKRYSTSFPYAVEQHAPSFNPQLASPNIGKYQGIRSPDEIAYTCLGYTPTYSISQHDDMDQPLHRPQSTYGTLHGEFVPIGVDHNGMPVWELDTPCGHNQEDLLMQYVPFRKVDEEYNEDIHRQADLGIEYPYDELNNLHQPLALLPQVTGSLVHLAPSSPQL
jgi:hypothetical protein